MNSKIIDSTGVAFKNRLLSGIIQDICLYCSFTHQDFETAFINIKARFNEDVSNAN